MAAEVHELLREVRCCRQQLRLLASAQGPQKRDKAVVLFAGYRHLAKADVAAQETRRWTGGKSALVLHALQLVTWLRLSMAWQHKH